MLSYSDIINYKFEKAGFGGGYRPEDVDKFATRVATDYQKLEQEKTELEHKLMTLAEKVEEYREDEESLRAALLGAQKLGDSIIRESKQKAEAMVGAARAEAEKIINDGRRQVEREQGALIKIQKEVSNFKNRLQILYKQHLELISSIPGPDVTVDAQEIMGQRARTPAPAPGPETYPGQQEAPIPDQPAVPQAPPVPPMEEPEPEQELPIYNPAPAGAPAQAPAHESRFGELKFGEGYDLHRT